MFANCRAIALSGKSPTPGEAHEAQVALGAIVAVGAVMDVKNVVQNMASASVAMLADEGGFDDGYHLNTMLVVEAEPLDMWYSELSRPHKRAVDAQREAMTEITWTLRATPARLNSVELPLSLHCELVESY